MARKAIKVRSTGPAARARADGLQKSIVDWLQKNDLYHDTRVVISPREGLVGVILTEGPLYMLVNGYYETPAAERLLQQFTNMLRRHGLWYDLATAWKLTLHPLSRR